MLASTLHAHYPIVFVIAPPRSLSVALLRIFEQTEQFKIFNEPFMVPRTIAQVPTASLEDFFVHDAFTTVESAKNAIFAAAELSPVLVKEESFAIVDILLADCELVTDPQIQFILLVRNPHHSALSLHKKMPFDWNPGGFDTVLGYQAAYTIFQHLACYAAQPPLILFSEDLYNQPENTVHALCMQLHIPFDFELLHWQARDLSFTGRHEWGRAKNGARITFLAWRCTEQHRHPPTAPIRNRCIWRPDI